MKNIKFAVLFLLLPFIRPLHCQFFDNFGAGFVVNLEGDFNKDISANASFVGFYNIKSIKCEAHISVDNNGSIHKNIIILPRIKNEMSGCDIAFYSGAIATHALLNQHVITTQKNQKKIDLIEIERKKLAEKRRQLHETNLEEQKQAKEKIITYLNQKNRVII